jgi:hypothetical protein
MQLRRFWIQTVGLCVSVAVVFAVIIALLTATAVLALGQKDPAEGNHVRALSGVLTDSRCQGRHPGSSRMTSAQCTLFCMKQGASWVLVDGDVVYVLKGDSPSFDKLAGQRVKMTGLVEGNNVQVQGIEPTSP